MLIELSGLFRNEGAFLIFEITIEFRFFAFLCMLEVILERFLLYNLFVLKMVGGEKMKKLLATLVLPMAIFLTGCSTVEEVSNSLKYVTEATEYVNDVNQFANELPALAEAAVTDVNSRIQLEELLTEMQSDIEEFNVLEAPAMLEDIHNQVVEHNMNLANGIELYLENIEEGTLSSELLSEIGLLEEVAVYTDLLSQIIELSE